MATVKLDNKRAGSLPSGLSLMYNNQQDEGCEHCIQNITKENIQDPQ